MIVTLDRLQDEMGREGYSLTKFDGMVLTFAREGEAMVFCDGAFYLGHQVVIETDHFLSYIARFWDADLAARLDERFKGTGEFGLDA